MLSKARLRQGFSLVELIVVVTVIGVLSVAAYVGIQHSKGRSLNVRVQDDLAAISNALEQYKKDNGGSYPIPATGGSMNLSCFYASTAYAHDCDLSDFRQGMVDNNLLTRRYLPDVPTDPRTGSRYVYGVTGDGKYFQLAGNVQDEEGNWLAYVTGNLSKGYHLPSLVRAFNGPNFVVDNSGYLAYSPDHLNITAELKNIQGTITVTDEMDQAVSDPSVITLYPGYTITAEDASSSVDIYFSDGSLSTLGPGPAQLEILPSSGVEENDGDNIITKIRLKLFSGMVWSKVARLASESEFNIETTTSIAGVRGTEFGLEADIGGTSRLYVYSGEVGARQKTAEESGEETVSFSKNDFSDAAGTLVVGAENPLGPDDLQVVTITGVSGDPINTVFTPVLINNAGTVNNTTVDPNIVLDRYTGRELFNNNFQPRILSIDGDGSGAEITFANLHRYNLEDSTSNLTYLDVVACRADELSSCDLSTDLLITCAEVCGSVGSADGASMEPYTIQITSSTQIAGEPVLNGEKLVFYYRTYVAGPSTTDTVNSAFSQPPIALNADTRLAENDIYGFEEDEGVLAALDPTTKLCGDTTFDPLVDTCDTANFYGMSPGNNSCASYDPVSFSGGTLSCIPSDCSIEPADCVPIATPTGYCGDGDIQRPNGDGMVEDCESEAGMGGEDIFFYGGSETSNNACEVYDSSAYEDGNLICDSCQIYTDLCEDLPPPPPVYDCGNGIVETGGGEQCDDANEINEDDCTNACRFPACNDGILSDSEQCDGTLLAGATCTSAFGSDYLGGTGSPLCSSTSCVLQVGSCQTAEQVCEYAGNVWWTEGGTNECITPLEATCLDNDGFWDETREQCILMGNAGQSCSDACLAATATYGVTLSCDIATEADWERTDMGSICVGLNAGAGIGAASPLNYAPFYGTLCQERNPSATVTNPCPIAPPATRSRVCVCG